MIPGSRSVLRAGGDGDAAVTSLLPVVEFSMLQRRRLCMIRSAFQRVVKIQCRERCGYDIRYNYHLDRMYRAGSRNLTQSVHDSALLLNRISHQYITVILRVFRASATPQSISAHSNIECYGISESQPWLTFVVGYSESEAIRVLPHTVPLRCCC